MGGMPSGMFENMGRFGGSQKQAPAEKVMIIEIKTWAIIGRVSNYCLHYKLWFVFCLIFVCRRSYLLRKKCPRAISEKAK